MSRSERYIYQESEMLILKQEDYKTTIAKALFIMIFVNFFALFFAILNYPAKYDMWGSVISELGVNIVDGNVNYVSKSIFTMMCLFNSILFLSVFIAVKSQNTIVAVGCLFLSLGNFLMAFPMDLYYDMHNIGVIVAMFSLLFVVCYYFISSKYTMNIILAFIILILAFLYGWYNEPISQKVFVFATWFMILIAKTQPNVKMSDI
jgi:hypothetical protein